MIATLLPFAHYRTHLAAQSAQLAADAAAAGLAALVPTCPGWSVADLVHHQGVVHRWAAAHVRGASAEDADAVGTAAETERPADLLTWFSAGATDLDRALAAASDDLAAARFLADPPTPREFWARRQAHETTIHRVDALSARLGVLPTAAQAHLDPALAADGIDELLTGFLPRRRSTLRSADAFTVTIAPTDADLAWTVRVSDDPPVTRRGSDPRADAVLAGRVAALYLGLWNRGDEIAETGDQEVLGLWRDLVRISWS